MQKTKLNQDSKKLKKSNFKTVFSLSISFALILLLGLVSFTYSWVFATDFSDITGMNISLAESQGLVMSLDGQVAHSIDINAYLAGSLSTFALKEASSTNGRDLFLRDEGMYFNDVEGIYDGVNVARDDVGIIQFRQASMGDRNTSFIYFNLNLEATGDNRYLIFDSANCYIEDISNQPVEPIRVSLTFVEGENINTYIIGNRQEYLGNYHTEAVTSIYAEDKVGYTSNQDVSFFSAYNGYTSSVFDSNKTLYYLEENTSINMIVRIWLEGGDPLCTNYIAGTELNVSLAFDNIAESEVV